MDILPKSLEELLPKVVRERAKFGHGTWLGEFRTLTIVRIVPHAIQFGRNFQTELQSFIQPAASRIPVPTRRPSWSATKRQFVSTIVSASWTSAHRARYGPPFSTD